MTLKAPHTIKEEDDTEIYSTLNLSNIITSNEEYNGDINKSENSVETKAVRIGPSMELKAVKAREKALIDKFAVVRGLIQTPLEKDEGVVIDCFYHANEKNAPVSSGIPVCEDVWTDIMKMDKAFSFTHLMKLKSDNPFNLVKLVCIDVRPLI